MSVNLSKGEQPSCGCLGCLGVLLIIIIASLIKSCMAPDEVKEPPAPPAVVEEKTAPIKEVEKSPVIKDVKGRGRSDQGRNEPQYVGLDGYVVVGSEQKYEISNYGNFVNTPWKVPTFVQDKQFWNKTDVSLEHKTAIRVKKQMLSHTGYGHYKGYLLVSRLNDNAEFYINVDNFVTKPYWTFSSVDEASKVGVGFATYHQKSNFYPVYSDGTKYNLEDGRAVFVEGHSSYGARNNPQNRVCGEVFSNGYEHGSEVYFNEADLTWNY